MPASKGRSLISPGQLDPSRKLVLTIDDEYEAQEILRTYLKSDGYEVMQAYSGLEAHGTGPEIPALCHHP